MNTVIKYEVSINHKNKSGVKYTLTHDTENNILVDNYVINDDHIDVYYKNIL